MLLVTGSLIIPICSKLKQVLDLEYFLASLGFLSKDLKILILCEEKQLFIVNHLME